MRIKKVLILIDLNHDLKCSETPQYFELEDWKMEKKIVNALKRSGYEVACVAVKGNIYQLEKEIKEFLPDVIFNLSEALWMDRKYEPYFISFVESFRIPVTGAPSDLLLKCKNKAITKSILSNSGVDVGNFFVLSDNNVGAMKHLKYPLIVKPLENEASEGISKNSVVKNEEELIERVNFLRRAQVVLDKNVKSAKILLPVLIEEFVSGHEIYVSLIRKGKKFVIFEPRLLSFGKIKNPLEKLATYHAKWNDEYRAKWKINSKPVNNSISMQLKNKVIEKAIKISEALEITGYVRIDFRVDSKSEEVICLEVNPNPSIYPDDEFALSARSSGIKFTELLKLILEEAVESHQNRLNIAA